MLSELEILLTNVLQFVNAYGGTYIVGVCIYACIASVGNGYINRRWDFSDFAEALLFPISIMNFLGSLILYYQAKREIKSEAPEAYYNNPTNPTNPPNPPKKK